MSMEKIREAFSNELYSNFNGSYEIAYINKTFVPSGEQYLREDFLPSRNEFATLGKQGRQRLSGIYQITVVVKTNTGIAYESILSALKAVFYAGRSFIYEGQAVHITSAERATLMIDDTWVKIPFSINFEAYENRY